MQSTLRNRVSSASTVASNVDLLTEILLRLPVKSLIRFKSVSKHWLALISDPYFCGRHSGKIINPIPTGIFLHRSLLLFNPLKQQDGEPVYLVSDESPVNPLSMAFSFVSQPSSDVSIVQSCNGLLLLRLFREHEQDYFVYNPTTRQFRAIPKVMDDGNFKSCVCWWENVQRMSLAFQPSKSATYKVVCVRFVKEIDVAKYTAVCVIEIFSSEAGTWRVCGEPFCVDFLKDQFDDGVFYNQSIYWVCYRGDSLYFNVDEERLHTLPMPPVYNEMGEEEENGDNRRVRHFGECRGHLNLVEMYESPIAKFNVYELGTNDTGWFIKYRLDVGLVTTVLEDVVMEFDIPTETDYFNCGVLSFVQGEKEDDTFLVLHINEKLVRYDVGDGTFTKLCEDVNLYGACRFGYSGTWLSPLLFIESLSSV